MRLSDLVANNETLKLETIKILHLDNNHPLLKEQLQNAGFSNEEDFTSTKEEIEKIIHNYNGIIIRSRFKIDKTFLDKATNLQFIARVGAGLESINCDYATQKGIHLIAAPEGNCNAVGEHAIGMLLSLLNKLNNANKQVKNGKWIREGNRGFELEHKTIGIIGYGNMGKSFAKKLRGFDVNVIFYDILENIGDANAKQVSLEELQLNSDVLSLHIPWNETTDKLVNTTFINQFAKSFWFINTSRGKNVVTADLVLALQSGKILGAGLDVLEYEKLSFEDLFLSSTNEIPLPLQYLLQAENVLLSPHIAGWTFESHEKLAQTIVNKITSFYNKEKVEKPILKRVTGLGGIFFKAQNSKELLSWYGKYLGLKTDDYGATFWWKDKNGNNCATQFSPMSEKTNYFSPSEKQFMLNFRVENLESLLEVLKQEGITIVGEMETYDYGKFGWILDPEGNKIELWEPIDSVFQ